MCEAAAASPTIPSADRTPMSIVVQVKNTLLDLISGTLRKIANGNGECDSGEGDGVSSEIVGSNLGHNRSKEEYKRRLSTFTLSYWCGKPLTLCPPLLAQYGWECIGEDIIKCCTCAAIVTVRLPWSNSSNYHEQCQKASQKIISGHMKICSWPSNGCSDSYLNPFQSKYLTKQSRKELVDDFVLRVNSLLLLNNKLPLINDKILSEMNLSSELITDLSIKANLPIDQVKDNEKDSMQVSCVVLALCGWTTNCNKSTLNPSIYCEETSRKVGLWNFYSVADRDCIEGENQSAASDEAPAKKSKMTDHTTVIAKSFFHPTNQHHVWSPWTVSLRPLSFETSQQEDVSAGHPIDTDEDPGWKTVLSVLLDRGSNEEGESLDASVASKDVSKSSPTKTSVKTPPRVALKAARMMLQEWSSPR